MDCLKVFQRLQKVCQPFCSLQDWQTCCSLQTHSLADCLETDSLQQSWRLPFSWESQDTQTTAVLKTVQLLRVFKTDSLHPVLDLLSGRLQKDMLSRRLQAAVLSHTCVADTQYVHVKHPALPRSSCMSEKHRCNDCTCMLRRPDAP